MNEKFAIEPSACKDSMEWRYLLDKFGPFTGRYGVKFPQDWEERLLGEISTENWREIEKIKVILRRALEEKVVLNMKGQSRYIDDKDWIENIESDRNARSEVFKLIVKSKRSDRELDLESFDLPPTAGERVPTDVDSFIRVSEVLLLIAPELYFVDPFLNPLRDSYYEVLVGMLRVATRGSARRVSAWTSDRKVDASESEIRDKLTEIKRRSGFGFPVELLLVDDSASAYKLHDRWLFTQYGGIGYSQGFQRQPRNRQMNVWPMDKAHFNDCWLNLREGMADFSTRSIRV